MIEAYRALVTKTLGASALEAAREHARTVFPNESCGFISTIGEYYACENSHETPETHFQIKDDDYDRLFATGQVRAVVHSHPNGPAKPSHADMMAQIDADVPFVIITLNEDNFGPELAWGGNLPIAPLISRPFVHGIFDCYSMVRDIYRLGKDELAKQGIHWPLAPIDLPEFAREDEWWKGDDDLYMTNFAKYGFREIAREEARAGDGFLMALGNELTNPKKKINHAGVLLEHDQILHQLPNSPSARRPTGPWFKAVDMWVRYEGPSK